MNKFTYTLSAPQSQIYACDKRYVTACCGRRFGKSFCAGLKIIERATSDRATQRGDYIIWYVAPTKDLARDVMWNWLKEHVPREYLRSKNEVRMEMVFKNGCSVRCYSADEPDHLVGRYIDYLVMDECAVMKNGQEVYDKISPALTDKYCDGDAMFISTPRGYNWFYDLCQNATLFPDEWAYFSFTTLEGGNVSEDELERERRLKTPKMFAQEYLASFESMANRIYDCFDKEKNSCEMDDGWGLGDIHVGMDFNVNPMTAAIAVMETDRNGNERAVFFDEILMPSSNTAEMAEKIREKYPAADVWVYPDPTGKKHQTSAPVGVTDFTILQDAGFHVLAPYAPYPSKDKWNSVNAAFCNAKGERRAFIARGKCPSLRKAFDGYSFKENGDPDKSGGLDHISDAAAYFLAYRFPVRGHRARVYRPQVLGV